MKEKGLGEVRKINICGILLSCSSIQITRSLLKGIKYEIRLGKPNRPIDEPNGPMSTSPKKVEPILRVGP